MRIQGRDSTDELRATVGSLGLLSFLLFEWLPSLDFHLGSFSDLKKFLRLID